VGSYGAAAPIAFILIYALAVMALIPATLLTIVGGALFGVLPGASYAMAGAILGSMAAFQLGRHAARRLIAKRLIRWPRFVAIDRAVSVQGLSIVLLLRLSPITPFNVLNYALGLTALSAWDFLLASIGMIPGTFMYAYCGKIAGLALALAGKATMPREASYYALLLGGLAATIGATLMITRTAQRALRDV
jgi:uncharacterized membrane protein YdjX (TVP38/TMEM64 family)